MKHCLRFLILLSALSWAAGCAPVRTQATSVVDADYQGGGFSSFLVIAEGTSGLSEQKAIEDAVATALGERDVTAKIAAAQMVSGKDYTEAALKDELAGSQMEALLSITPIRKEVEENYVPPTYQPGFFAPQVSIQQQSIRNPAIPAPTTQTLTTTYPVPASGGYYVEQPVARYKAVLYSLPDFRRVWHAELRAQGSGGMEFTALGSEIGERAATQLAEDGLLEGVARTE